MLDKLPLRVMEGILARLDPWSHLQLALSCPEMWDVVEETPKKYHTIRWIDLPAECCNHLSVVVAQHPGQFYESQIPLYQITPPEWALPVDDVPLLKAGCKGTETSLYRTALIRLLFLNATIHQMSDAPFSFGHKFWASLNLKVTRIANPISIPTFKSLRKFLGHFNASGYFNHGFLKLLLIDPHGYCDFLQTPEVRSMDSLCLALYTGALAPFSFIRAKHLVLDLQFRADLFKWDMIGCFLEGKIWDWLEGEQEIDRIHLITAQATHAQHKLRNLVARLSRKLPAELGWIDRTYKGMALIVRATDGQALVVYLDTVDLSIYLLRCDYNFRRGRCLGSYERNGKALARIRQLMCIYAKLNEEKPLLAAEAKEKLMEECINFNKYNNGATTVDLLTDAIWRSTGKRRSPWGVYGGQFMDGVYPVDPSLRHAYQFTKAFEERGDVLPEIDEFKPASQEEIERCKKETMLNKLPPRVMARILWLITPMDCLSVAFVSRKMWGIVEATPKMYGMVRCIMKDGALYLSFMPSPEPVKPFILPVDRMIAQMQMQPGEGSNFAGLMDGSEDFIIRLCRTTFFRMLFRNSMIDDLFDMPLSFGNKFWFSLNMKVTRISEPKAVASISQLRQFLEHFQPTELVYNYFFADFLPWLGECERFLRSDFIRGLQKLHLYGCIGDVRYLRGVRAKDLLIGVMGIDLNSDFKNIFGFLLRRVSDWLQGKAEIDKIQICIGENLGAEKMFKSLVDKVAITLKTEMGWIDRTYEGMELILRASDGQALLVFWDDAHGYFYLIRCEYNFRRGRCLGSYERNEESIRKICDLMRISLQLATLRPALAEDAKEKLKEECIRFTEYNKGATTVDLMMDSIWRPKGDRRSPWVLIDGKILHDNVNPMNLAVLHAYRFVRAFGETGVLPEIYQFQPLDR